MLKNILPVLFLAVFLNAQDKNYVVAKAGNKDITVTEFIARYNLNPQLEIHRKAQSEANKEVFLYAILAEKLLSLDAEEKKLDTSSAAKYFIKNFEKMFVRDELYNVEVKQKSQKYAADLLSFYLENSSRIFTKNIISEDSVKIDRIFSLLQLGVPFDSIYTELPVSEKDTLTIYSGMLDPETERQIFSIQEKNFSSPLFLNNYYLILYVETKNDPVTAKSLGWESEYKRLEKNAAERAEAVYYQEFMKNFFPGKKAEAKGFLIKSLAEKIHNLFSEQIPKDDKYIAGSSDLVKIHKLYSPDTLNTIFAVPDNDTILFNDFLFWLRTQNFEVNKLSYDKIAAVLNAKVKTFIEYELLSKEGYRRGLENTENVKLHVSMWRDNYLSQLNMLLTADSLYKGSENFSYFKVLEIVNSDLSVIEKVLNELSSGNDFLRTAEKYSLEKADTSFRHIMSFGDLRDDILTAKAGNVYGPVNSDKGYIVFKIIDQKKSDGSGYIHGGKTSSDPMTQYIASLAARYGININNETLRAVKVSNINAMVFKYLGFGGKISAVPVIKPAVEWVREWQKEAELNP